MRQCVCDKCGVLMSERSVNFCAYTEGHNIKFGGYGESDYFIKLDLCKPCARELVDKTKEFVNNSSTQSIKGEEKK